jgi:predicted metal-binding membrane protein
MNGEATLEALLQRDRRVVVYGLAATAALAWAYQIYLAWGMEHMSPSMAALMPNMQEWRGWDLFLLFAMWAVMMVAMMVPSVAPTILAFAAINRKRREQDSPFAPTGVFVAGYLAAWAAFSLAATMAQWGLHAASLVSSAMVATSPLLGGALLVATGIFQWTRLKEACLARCRSPVGFILTHWRDGLAGSFRVGFLHGSYCVGCCALLMALLFVNGVMNIWWMAVLTAFVLVERLVPASRLTGRVVGLLLFGWGLWMLRAA